MILAGGQNSEQSTLSELAFNRKRHKLYMSELKLELTQLVLEMVPGQIDDVMPELPSATGPAIELPTSPF